MRNDRLEKRSQAEVRFIKTTGVRGRAECWAWLFTPTVFNPSHNHLTQHVCNKAIYLYRIIIIKNSVLISWVLYACNIYHCHSELPVFLYIHLRGCAAFYPSGSGSALNYWLSEKNRVYRDLGLQTPIKMDLSQTLWRFFSVVFITDAAEEGLSLSAEAGEATR